ncbi:MAG: hypothetical protein HYV27_18630 [Candidatus Hydrogenedentes bacterium]|nr:hypothetical protein [Candidatus Hydrogenedentota bacterium]
MRLLLKLGGLAAFNAIAGLAFLVLHSAGLDYATWETDSRLCMMPEGARHKAVVLGTSHAYVFSRLEPNHKHLEDAAGGPVVNLALPTGGGVWPARIYLEQYLAEGNRAEALIYFLEPFVLYNDAASTAHKFVYFEPFRFDFLLRLIREGYPPRRIFTYVRSKFSSDYVFQGPRQMDAFPWGLRPEHVTAEGIRKRMEMLYLEGRNPATFARYRAELEKILALAEAHHMRVRIVTPPTLLGHEPGQPAMEEALGTLAQRHAFVYRDFTDAMPDPALYYNLDHMNTPGVAHFCKELLGPFLAQAG